MRGKSRKSRMRGGSHQVLLAFDMDETIGNVWQFFPMVDALIHDAPDAYKIFVKEIAKRERTTTLGLIRPGLVAFFEKIAVEQQFGNVGPVVLYSNNSAEEMLTFTQDLIHELVGRPIIQFCAHWGHPIRANEINPNQPGSGQKTWATLVNIFRACGVEATPERTLFFDDQIHPNLVEVLQENYIHVNAYSYRIPKQIRIEILKESVTDPDFFQSHSNLLSTNTNTATTFPPRMNKSMGHILNSFYRVLRQGKQNGGVKKTKKHR
jgi:hypothetical protein